MRGGPAARSPAERAERLERLERLRDEVKRDRAKAKAKREREGSSGSRRDGSRSRSMERRRWADPSTLRDFAWLGVRLAVPILLPFVTLVGGSAWSYRLLGLPTWAALGVAIILTAACLTLFGVRFAKALSSRYRARRVGMRMGMRIALPIVAIYCAYALLFLARENAKTEAVHTYFTAVHPLLRLAIGTAILADPAIVLTETARTPAAYRGMGLPPRENSLHYRQRDGYIHAIDLRTAGRSWIRNATTRAYFTLLGFETLRHVGTADHLHVALPVK